MGKGEVKKISGKKRNRRSIKLKVDFYEFCVYSFYVYSSLLHYECNNMHSSPPDLWYLLYQGKGVQEVFSTRI